jgi:NAD(P)-dependent dehydrogenase (short-subunit alcohol dehydrogenase family)
MTFKDKNILIVGASSGIGRATAVFLSKNEAVINIIGRNNEKLENTFFELKNNSLNKKFILDINNEIAIIDFAIHAVEYDGIVLCAGEDLICPLSYLKKEIFLNLFANNVASTHNLIYHLLKRRKIKSQASIVFLSSVEGNKTASIGHTAYGATKAALTAYSKGLALELSSKKIKVNCIEAAMIQTPMINSWLNSLTKEEIASDINNYPLKRYGNVDDIVNAIVFLLSDKSSWITGTSLVVDGGYTLK